MSRISEKRISYKKVLCGSILLVSIFIYASILFTIYSESNIIVDLEFENIKRATELHSSNMLAIAIESGNKDFLDTTLAGLVSYNFIYSITVLDKSRDIVAFVINDDFSEMEVDNLRSKEVPIFSTNPNSKKHITKSRHIDHQEQVGSLLISSTNILGNKRTYSPLESAFLLSVLFAVVTAAMIFFVTRSIKQNVSHMVLSAKRLAEGENGIRLSEDSRITEVWEFSKSFRTSGSI